MLIRTPTNVRTLGWMRSWTHARMMSWSGYMQSRPMSPVKVMYPLQWKDTALAPKTRSVSHANP